MMEEKKADTVKAAVDRLKAVPGQDGGALELVLEYARRLHATATKQRKLLADARAYALMQACFCEGGRKCERCRLVAGIGKVLG